MNGCAPGLALIERLKATRKWAISLSYLIHDMLININSKTLKLIQRIFVTLKSTFPKFAHFY